MDKSAWADGQWQQEPDRIEWVYLGFPCLMIRQEPGFWCGYVGISPTHPCYGKDRTDDEIRFIRVHGKITFSEQSQQDDDPRAVCHKLLTTDGNYWWLGFDCTHNEDISPIIVNIFNYRNSTYKNVEYVKKQVEFLAQQLNLETQ